MPNTGAFCHCHLRDFDGGIVILLRTRTNAVATNKEAAALMGVSVDRIIIVSHLCHWLGGRRRRTAHQTSKPT